jgi:ABC-type lipoprotein release transport system permease subunit
MALGTAALVIILSVYNGFNRIVEESLSDVDPDILITPATGKAFIPEGPVFDALYDDDRVLSLSCVVEEDVFISYDGKQSLARAKGVDAVYEEESLLRRHLTDGTFTLHNGDVKKALVGAGLAYKMGINPRFVPLLEVYFPDRKGKVSLTNPAGSVRSIKAKPAGVFSVNADMDAQLIVLPIESMRELLGYEEEVTGVEVRLREGISRHGEGPVCTGPRLLPFSVSDLVLYLFQVRIGDPGPGELRLCAPGRVLR